MYPNEGAAPMAATQNLYFIMSKGNMLLGHARGKVGSIVFSRSNGKQIVRAKADVVKNPKTLAQTIQRIMLNTISQAYSKMSAICDHSFEGVKVGQDSMSYFMRQNLNALRKKVSEAVASGATMEEIFSFSPLGSGIFVPNDYLISKGKLPSVAVIDASSDAQMAAVINGATYQTVIDSIGGQRGDQLTFVGVVGSSIDTLTFKFARIILDPTDANGDQLPLTTDFLNGTAVNMPNPRNEGAINLAVSGNNVEFDFGDTYIFAGAVIVSRKGSDESWLRSDATLTANASSSEQVYNLQLAIDLSEQGNIDTPNARYLNNSGNGRMAEGGAITSGSSIASVTVGGDAVQRGAAVSPAFPGSIVATVTEGEDAGTLQVALRDAQGNLTKQTAVENFTATIEFQLADVAGRSLVLLEDGQVVDTYCSFT